VNQSEWEEQREAELRKAKLEPWPDWMTEAADVLNAELLDMYFIAAGGYLNPVQERANRIAAMRRRLREAEQDARRASLEQTLRAELLADIRRRS
jgi:hypothetical protein